MNEPRDQLSDPAYAAFAWARYRRVLRWMAWAALGSVLAALAWLWMEGSLRSIHVVIATMFGVGGTVLLTGALMGLVFLSSGSGHDTDASEGGQPRP